MMKRQIDASADILVFPHHGGSTGTTSVSAFTQDLCDLVQPKTVIFSLARNSTHPLPEIIQTIHQSNINVRIACTQLSQRCAAQVPTTAPNHIQAFSMGNERRQCCAGTIVIDLDEFAMKPEVTEHRAFIEQNAQMALCV